METLINCNINIKISYIEKIVAKNQRCEMYFRDIDGIEFLLEFDFVWDLRSCIENALIERCSKFIHEEQIDSDVLIVKESEYIAYFATQVSGTRPLDNLHEYLIFDSVDTIVEVLTNREPILIKL